MQSFMRFLADEGEVPMRKAAFASTLMAAVAVLGCQTLTEVMPTAAQNSNPNQPNPVPVVVVPIPIPTPIVATPAPAPNPNPGNPNPAPSAQPNPNPNPNPPDTGGGDVPDNTNPVAKLTAKVYFVENYGQIVDYPPAHVGDRIHLDVTPTDSSNRHTQVRGSLRWTYSNTSIVNVTGASAFNPVLEARDTGDLTAYAEVDGVRSNTISITIR